MRIGWKKQFILCLTLFSTACNTIVPDISTKINAQNTITLITDTELRELDTEYSFKTKALLQSYLKRKIEKWLDTANNGAGKNGKMLVKELEYAMAKGEDIIPFKALMASFPDLYDKIILINEVLTEKTFNPPFALFLDLANPHSVTLGKFTINSGAAYSPTRPSVASDKNGNFAVAWAAYVSGIQYVYARLYNSSGIPQTSDILVNTTSEGSQPEISIGMSANGRFVVSWIGGPEDASLFAQRFNADGSKNGSEINITAGAGVTQDQARVGVDGSGNFVIVWREAYDIFAKKYNADGTMAVDRFPVNTTTEGFQWTPGIAMNDNGDFVTVWHDDSSNSTFSQKFNSDCTKYGGEIIVNVGDLLATPAAIDNNGNYWITWSQYAPDVNGYDVYARKYNSDTTVAIDKFRINDITVNDQQYSSIALRTNGEFVISWSDIETITTPGDPDSFICQREPDNCFDITANYRTFIKRFTSNGTAQGSEIIYDPGNVNLYNSRIAASSITGNFVVVTEDNSSITGIIYNNNGNEL